MKILQLCKKFPYPVKDGESLAVMMLSKPLCQLGCEVSLLAMNTAKHRFGSGEIPSALSHYAQVRTVEIDNRLKPLDAFLNLFSRQSYHISRFISPAFSQQLAALLSREQFDIVQLETPYLAPYIPVIRQYSQARIAMRAHNIEHEIWQRIAANTRLLPKKWYLQHLVHKLRRYELEQLEAYDILVPITERDLQSFRSFGFRQTAVVAPIGLDCQHYLPDYSSYGRPPSLSFIGSLDWMPNQEGLQWFLDQVWPLLHRRFPSLELHVAGRNTPKKLLQQRWPQVFVHGEVPDAAAFINQHSMMVVPLHSGSGMRAKILEGMALGKTVLTTSMGLEGIAAQHGREVLIADNPGEFVEQIAHFCQQGREAEALGRAARAFVENGYDSHAIARRLLKAYEALILEAV
jgi:polysaccharide biosynthesis protein PslH